MNGILVLIPIALGLGLAGLAAFFWAVRDGQFEDLDGASMRILIEDDRFIHAYQGHSVLVSALVPHWRRRIAGVFAFPPLPAGR